MNGPDQIIPTDDLSTWRKDGVVKLRVTEEYPGNREPQSLVTFTTNQCNDGGDRIALSVRRNGDLLTWTYKQYLQEILAVAKAFISLGLEPHNGVAIWGFNSPEWFIADIAAIFAGGLAVGLYPTNSQSVNQFILQDCCANILVVEDEKYAEKILAIRNELPHLKKIIQYTGKPPTHPDIVSWKDLVALGKDNDDTTLSERQKRIAINHCAMLVYTSGTTGMPKGVMLSHDNIFWMANTAREFIKLREYSEVAVSYLPLSHVAANMVDIWSSMTTKGSVFFADKMALKGTLLNTLREARPTFFLGVPRVWEKIMEGMLDKGKNATNAQKMVAKACKLAGLRYHLQGRSTLMYNIGKKVVYKKIREALGLDRCVAFYSGAAPMSKDTLRYFLSIDIVILELYGMSETTGSHLMSYYDGNHKIGSVGRQVQSGSVKIVNEDGKGEGELCMAARNIMMGYLNREDKTREDIDEDGWLHSGDLAVQDDEGFVFITGRIKELLITAGGENVSPVPIEDAIKKELPCISNVILIGDKKKFLSCFLTLKVVVDKESDQPTQNLLPEAIEWCKSVGSQSTTVEDILRKPDSKVLSAIQEGISRANEFAVSNAARVQRWMILPKDLSIGGGELGPTLKLKRFYVNQKYADAIEKLYD